MKKKLLIISAIVASIGLTACGDKDNVDNDEPIVKVEVDDERKDEVKEDSKDVVNDTNDKVDNTSMTDEEMIDTSDYIAKVKRIKEGKSVFELKVLENIKGNLTGKEIPKGELLNENRTYLVFLRDVDGTLEATDGTDSYILLEGDNHEIFEKINKKVNR